MLGTRLVRVAQLHKLTIYQLIQQPFLPGMEFTARQNASPLERRDDQCKHETARLSICVTTEPAM